MSAQIGIFAVLKVRQKLRDSCLSAALQRVLLVVFGSAIFRERVETAKPFHQKREMAAVLVAHGRELQSQSAAGFFGAGRRLQP